MLTAIQPTSTRHHSTHRPSLEETLSRFETGKYAKAAPNRPSIQVPNDHKPGPLSGVVLPKPTGRPRGVTEIEAVITVDQYKGTIHGRNGDHEIIEGHITLMNAVGNKKVFDTKNVELAMNVATKKDPNGLPSAIPVKAGDQIEVEGEYIPSKQAKAPNANGAAAVIHFTHAPDGYVIFPDASEYK